MHLRLLSKIWVVQFCDARGDKKITIGWEKFVQDNDLKMGDICLFELLSNQRKTMEVYVIRLNDADN